MRRARARSGTEAQFGRLPNKADKDKDAPLPRKHRLNWIKAVAGVEPIPLRPFGYFAVETADPMVMLANAAPASKPGLGSK